MKLGVVGGRSARWTVPLPGVEAEAGKGEGIVTWRMIQLLVSDLTRQTDSRMKYSYLTAIDNIAGACRTANPGLGILSQQL